MSHRVIAGRARGRKLKMVPGDSTRPIMDRVKEALFNILNPELPGCRFLDLFGGSGAVGIEALSRGAGYVRFIDNNRRAIQTIKENLAHTRLETDAEVLLTDALAYLTRQRPPQFDMVYIAPPQYHGIWKKALLALDRNPAHLYPDALVIAQVDPHERDDGDPELTHLNLYDERQYGNTRLLFFEYYQERDDGSEEPGDTRAE